MGQLDTGLVDAEAPRKADRLLVAPLHPGGDLPFQGGAVGDASRQALPGHGRQLQLGHVQPTAMLGGVVPFQPRQNAPRLGRGKVWYSAAGVWVLRLSVTKTIRSAAGNCWSTRSRSAWAKSTAVRRAVTRTWRQPR